MRYTTILIWIVFAFTAAAGVRQLLSGNLQRSYMAFSAQKSVPQIDTISSVTTLDTATFALG